MSDNKYTYNNIPRVLKTVIHTHYKISGYDAGSIKNYDFDCTGEDYIKLAETQITVKIPPQKNIKETVVNALQEEKKKQMAEHEKKMNEIQAKIDSLLCIEHFEEEPFLDNVIPF